MPRMRVALTAIVALLGVAVIAVVAATAGGRDSGPGAGDAPGVSSAPLRFEGAVLPAGIPPARFALRDQDGRLVRMTALRGRPVVVTFLYSHCKDTCPLTAMQIRGALDRLPHPIPVVAVSVDPAGDTRASVDAFLRKVRMTGRMEYLMGTRAQLAPIWHAYGVLPQRVDAEHTADTTLLDARGAPRVGYQVDVLTPEVLAHDIRVLERS